MTELLDAATVIVLRATPVLEVLLVRRHARSGFMGGAYVFPGGKLDPADLDPAFHSPALLEHAAALKATPGRSLAPATAAGLLLAAVRETQEEAGLRLDPLALRYFSHWITPSLEPRRFDTRFFLAWHPPGQVAKGDEREVTDLIWRTPTAALSAHDAGTIFLPPPTQASLLELADLADHAAIEAHLKGRPIGPILPKVLPDPEGFSILLPWDPDYAATPGEGLEAVVRLPGPTRILVRPRL